MPASTVIVFEARSISRSLSRRKSDKRILVAAFVWDLAADKARIAALRNEFRAGLVAERDNGRDFGSRARTRDTQGFAFEEIARLDEIAGHVGLIGNDVLYTDDRREA